MSDKKLSEKTGQKIGRKIGLFGGTFDPIHFGHLFAASEVQHNLSLDKIIFVPTKKTAPGFKHNQHVATAQQRLEMCEIAIKNNSYFDTSDFEIHENSEFSYTIDLLKHYHQREQNSDLFLIIGIDLLDKLKDWKDFDQYGNYCQIVAVNRKGYEVNYNLLSSFNQEIQVLDIRNLAISSSDIRYRFGNNLPVNYLIPEAVEQFIKENQIY